MGATQEESCCTRILQANWQGPATKSKEIRFRS